ncbi:hypothetical protein I8752_25405 [Nostocaceae cyanobacterium CENA369]|jgi:hypothetical protein|uniref:Uncharacterized protein n=1 Tax=Dendronalium phyllosphericum CENA369 TaxID=1725256 RepID=A0A8J7LHK4_9NOST|nr:hypothetical protein [Dendronalium phyllosphericum]MBH8576268.1 hypothetical protein [Dendronalium phyllosphericum CENA369]
MSVQSIQPELFVELSTEQQQLISGGQFGRFPGGGGGQFSQGTPDITVRGVLTDSSGQSFPVRILGFIAQ